MARVAIVTGAAQGIGRAIALQLARDGIDLAVNDIPSKQGDLEHLVNEIVLLGQRAAVIPGDVSKEPEVQAMVHKTVDELGNLDIMVANAGVPQYHTPLLDVSDEDFDRVMNVNCKGTLYCYRAAAVQMIKQGRGGRIIGASSMVGIHASKFSIAYCVSKFSIRAITQTAALEWGQYKITFNAYAPGITDTPMLSKATGGASSNELAELFMGGACLQRPGQPEEIAALVAFLASENASYITGQTLSVNGGAALS